MIVEIKKQELSDGECTEQDCKNSGENMIVGSTGRCVDCELTARMQEALKKDSFEIQPSPITMTKATIRLLSIAVTNLVDTCRDSADSQADLGIDYSELDTLYKIRGQLEDAVNQAAVLRLSQPKNPIGRN